MISEIELTKIILERLKPYFHLYPEFKGEFQHWDQTRNVFLDIGCFPKEETIAKGFPKYFFGIEVKCFNLDSKYGYEYDKAYNIINQCISYKYSKFGNKKMEPAFILIADNLSCDNYKKEFKYENFIEYIRHTKPIRNFACHQNIGRLILNHNEISFNMHGSFWTNTEGFRHKEFLNFYCGNRDIRNRYKKVIKPFEHK